ASNNLSAGTSTPKTNTKFYIQASSTNVNDFALQILQPAQTPILVVRADGNVGIGTSAPDSATLTVQGTMSVSGGFSGTIAAQNVTPGVFNNGVAGAYSFPSALGIAT